MQLFHVTPERFRTVHDDIAEGSEPALRFYTLVAVSTLIASFGLISNSTAVVIGAMLVAPLMTPIFGIALALVRGETLLLGHALRAEIMGVLAAVIMGFILGALIGDFEPTSEMLARTRPNLFDLLVAVLAGFAGAYALVDEKISPALPGVAIATAIVPPLANSGLCLAQGELEGGLGSFLLFMANFLSILLVASVIFIASGMAKHYGAQSNAKSFVRRFGLPVISFVGITAFMVHSLYTIYEERRIENIINHTLSAAVSSMPSTLLVHIDHYVEDENVQVLAGVHTPRYFTPSEVSRIEALLKKNLGMPVELLVRCVLSNNVSSHGAVKNAVVRQLDGSFVRESPNETLAKIATTEQIIREYFSSDLVTELLWVNLININNRKIMSAQIVSLRKILPNEIAQMQEQIRLATKDNDIYLVISGIKKNLQTADGPLRYGWILGEKATPAIRQKISQIRSDLQESFSRDPRFELLNIYNTVLDDKLNFLLEIRGAEIYPQANVDGLQKELSQKHATAMELYAWSRVEVLQGSKGLESFNKLQHYLIERQKENLPKELPIMLESSGQ